MPDYAVVNPEKPDEMELPAKACTLLQSLSNSSDVGYRPLSDQPAGRPRQVDLALFQFDILYNSGKLGEAGKLLEQYLALHPHSFPLLLRLGLLDEKRGQFYNAFDLYRQIVPLAQTGEEKLALQSALTRVRNRLEFRFYFARDSFSIKITGNSRPLVLNYNLKQQFIRKGLLEAILRSMNKSASGILEIECDTGLITRTFTDLGFAAAGVAENMTDILLSLGFDSVAQMENPLNPGANYYQLYLEHTAAADIDPCDVIMILPSRRSWYSRRGIDGVKSILNAAAEKAKLQLYFWIPPVDNDLTSDDYFEVLRKELSFASSAKGKPMSGAVLSCEPVSGGELYRIDFSNNPGNEQLSVLSRGLEVFENVKRPNIFEIEGSRCRSEHSLPSSASATGEAMPLPWTLTSSKKVNLPTENTCCHLESEYGYFPELFPDGYKKGYFLKDKKDYRFLLTGNCRCNISHDYKGRTFIKAGFSRNAPLLVDIKEIEQWPGVLSGSYSQSAARDIFFTYFS